MGFSGATLKAKTGVLVELVVAVALLSIVSLAAVQLLNMTDKTMIGSQTKLSQQLRSESISSYIYKDFARGELMMLWCPELYQQQHAGRFLRVRRDSCLAVWQLQLLHGVTALRPDRTGEPVGRCLNDAGRLHVSWADHCRADE